MQRLRDVIHKADPRITEYVKHGSVQFAYDGDMAAYVKHGEKTVSLMFNRGARIKGKFQHLEGTHPSGRWLCFADEKDVAARSKEPLAVHLVERGLAAHAARRLRKSLHALSTDGAATVLAHVCLALRATALRSLRLLAVALEDLVDG